MISTVLHFTVWIQQISSNRCSFQASSKYSWSDYMLIPCWIIHFLGRKKERTIHGRIKWKNENWRKRYLFSNVKHVSMLVHKDKLKIVYMVVCTSRRSFRCISRAGKSENERKNYLWQSEREKVKCVAWERRSRTNGLFWRRKERDKK